MATQAQIEANRRNSQKSTGPRTAPGKAASARNATRHGLYAETLVIEDENAAEFDALQHAWFDDCAPQGQREIALVHELIRCDWLTRRTTTLEAQLWNTTLDDRREWLQDFNEATPLAHAYNQMSNRLVLIQRRLTALSRAFHLALRDLERLQAARPKSQTPPPEIGFVPKKEPRPSPTPDRADDAPAIPAVYANRPPQIGFVSEKELRPVEEAPR